MSKTVVIGVTGGFGTGKSTVCRMFGRLGAIVLDADRIAHDVIMPGGAGYKKVISLFGRSILSGNGRIDRRRLGRVVFKDKKKLNLLISVIHPEVIKRIKEIIKKSRSGGVNLQRYFVLDVPLLIEAGLLKTVDKLVVVTADKNTEIRRCLKKHGLKRQEISRRIRNQMPLSKKMRLADFIIDNNGSFNSTRKMVEKAWREIRHGARRNKD